MSEEILKSFVGKYFIDKYNLDGDVAYTRVLHIYRVNDVKFIEHGNKNNAPTYKMSCTHMSICYDEMKKTGEKRLVEAKISEIEHTPKMDRATGEWMNMFSNMEETDTTTWEKTALEIMSIVSEKAQVYTDLEHYCNNCKNNNTENCRFCCKRGDEKPTFYEQK